MVLIKKSFVHYRVSWICVMRGILFSLKNYYFFEVIITKLISSSFNFSRTISTLYKAITYLCNSNLNKLANLR